MASPKPDEPGHKDEFRSLSILLLSSILLIFRRPIVKTFKRLSCTSLTNMYFEPNRWLLQPCTAFEKGYLTLLLLFVPYISADGPGTITIDSLPAYSSQRPCVQYCLYSGQPNGAGAVNWALGCTNLNSCMCRADLASSASSFLTICVNTWCQSAAIDVNNAVSIFNAYCNAATASSTNIATTTVGSSSSGSTTSSQPPTTSPQPVTTSPSSNTSNDNSGPLSRSDRIALGVGLGIGIPSILIGVITLVVKCRN